MTAPALQDSPAVRDYQNTAAAIVHEQLSAIARRTDRMMALVMVLQWAAAVTAAIWYSPRTWVGTQSSIHIHVWAALFLGGALAGLPIYFATVYPGRSITRHVIAIAQMLWSALLIHLTGGRIETHFHVFGSLAFLAWYRSPSILLTATIVVTLDHLIRGLFWPQSVYGVSIVNLWRTIEHAGWVLFENIFLCLSIRCSLADMRGLAENQARVEHAHEMIEQEVELRTRELRNEIVERQAVQAELVKRDEQLRQSQKLEAVGSLAGGIAHEFNNLLQAIRGYTMFGMEGLSPTDQRHQDLEQVLKAADRAATLTRELLGFSRRQVFEWANFNPHDVVTDLVKMLRPLIGVRIDLQVSLDPDVQAVSSDRGLLQQMLLNLCINARDAMPEGGQLKLKTECARLKPTDCAIGTFVVEPGDYVVLSVSDTGCGMGPEVRNHIFEPFFTTKEVGKGTGLGLSMVYGCAQQHGGAIDVDSEPGKGTTFRIFLPMTDGVDSLAAERTADESAGGRETILIAEDEPMVRELAVRILTGAGYSVRVATNGTEAVELFESYGDEIALAVLDAIMPGLTGHQVYERIKFLNPQLPVIFCSGYDPATVEVKQLAAEDARIVQKPFDRETLLLTIREVLDGQPITEVLACAT